MIDLSAVEKTERWMHEHPGTAIIGLAGSLVAIGVIIGMAVATNVYDFELNRMFKEASETSHPLIFNDRLYSVQDRGDPRLNLLTNISNIVSENSIGPCLKE